jgi:hypothetical protein
MKSHGQGDRGFKDGHFYIGTQQDNIDDRERAGSRYAVPSAEQAARRSGSLGALKRSRCNGGHGNLQPWPVLDPVLI